MRITPVVVTVALVTIAGCDRLDEVDAERLARACLRLQAAGGGKNESAPVGPQGRAPDPRLNYDLLEATEAHSKTWEEIERKRGRFLPEGWKCGSYDPARYIR